EGGASRPFVQDVVFAGYQVVPARVEKMRVSLRCDVVEVAAVLRQIDREKLLTLRVKERQRLASGRGQGVDLPVFIAVMVKSGHQPAICGIGQDAEAIFTKGRHGVREATVEIECPQIYLAVHVAAKDDTLLRSVDGKRPDAVGAKILFNGGRW